MEEIIGKIYKQNCGDSILVKDKILKINTNGNKDYLYKVIFINYPYETLVHKERILKGNIENPEKKKFELLNKEFKQNCGDVLKIIDVYIKNQITYYVCEFKKYYYKFETKDLQRIYLGTVNNPQIEQVEFINKLWPQSCGDTLKVIKKTDKKQGNAYLWECEFLKYPYVGYFRKDIIIKGNIINPQIEKEEFKNKIWLQNCGDSLKIIEKTENKKNNSYLWKCEFINTKNIIFAKKSSIINRNVFNWDFKNIDKYPHLYKESLQNFIINEFDNKKVSLIDLSKRLNISITRLSILINKFNLRDYILYFPESKAEKYLRDFLYNLDKTTEKKANTNILGNYQEIDIYIPSKKLGIEYNGNYWHSSEYKEYNYHQNKSLLAKDKNLQIIHIWEWEYNERLNIIKAFLKSKLGIFNKIIYARKCVIKQIKISEYQNFCEENHLQGSCGAKIKLGLFYKDELIQVMSFGCPRFTDKYEWEIIRECSKLGYCIVGGKNKLWKYFVKNYNPKNCISYCDFSKFTGNSYLKLGFKLLRLNKPGFVWYDNKNNSIYPRTPWKHEEYKNLVKLFDAGQLVFIWSK